MPRNYRIHDRDSNEKEIVDFLRAHGALVWRINGDGIPDLLVGYRGKFIAMEVKRPLGPKGGKANKDLRPSQEKFFALANAERLPVALVRSKEEAITVLLGGSNVKEVQG